MYLENIKFEKDFRCFKKGEAINFKNQITVITGDNGSGKSTLLSCIRQCFKTKWSMSDDTSAKDVVVTNIENSDKQDISYLCFSSDLLQNSASFDDDIQLHMKVLNMSSGQGSLEQLVDKVEKSKDKKLLILDEPERGLSYKRVCLIFNYLIKHSEKNPNQQIIIVTHSPVLMDFGNDVFSTSHKKYISKSEYFKWMVNHKNLSPFSDEIQDILF